MKFIPDRRQAASEVVIGFLMENDQRVSVFKALPYMRRRFFNTAPGSCNQCL